MKEVTIPANIGKQLMERRPDLVALLSPREVDVLELALTGATVKQIAKQLHRSITTATSHVESIYEAVGVKQRTHLILAFAVLEAA